MGNNAQRAWALSDIQLFIEATRAESDLAREFAEHGTFHTDICSCYQCEILYRWNKLSWWQRLKAKLAF